MQEHLKSTTNPTQQPTGQQQVVLGLEKALGRMQLGFTIADVNGTILYSNPADASMHGFSPDELVGENVSVFAPSANRKPLTYQRLDELQSWERETTNVHKDGNAFPVRLVSNVVRDATGRPLAVVTSCEDLTERRRVEEAVRNVEDQLRQAQKMEAVGRLTGGIAHDFNNILTVITANAELISSSLSSDTLAEGSELQELTAAARRGRAMIKRLMGVFGQGALDPEPLDAAQVVGELTPSICSLLPEGIYVRHSIAASLPNIYADRGALEQILLNLVTNARDAMVDSGTLEVEAQLVSLDEAHYADRGWGNVGEYVCVSVRDTGAGMDEATKKCIFDPFFTTKAVGKGTGLGMSVVFGFMKQQRGFVDVESEVGIGTKVKLYFPLSHGRASHESVVPGAMDLPEGNETVLLVEDESPIRRAAVRVLERSGYTVLAAVDGEEGLAVFRKKRSEIALVVTDVVMPNMSGPQLFRLIRQEASEARFVFMSGYPTQEIRAIVALDPTIPFLIKPWTLSEFLQQVRSALDEPQGVCP